MADRRPGLIALRYRIRRAIGQGGSSRVYAAADTWLDDHVVALKILSFASDALAEYLAREFALLFRIRHPHIARVIELGRLHGELDAEGLPANAPFVVQELYAGESALDWRRQTTPSVADIACVGAQVAAALATLHAQGIHHGDVKPQNILVDGGAGNAGDAGAPHAKLIDFGLAAIGHAGAVAGTPRFMAPEALTRGSEPASDLYGLGATLVTLVTGEPPRGAHGAQQSSGELGNVIAALTHPSVEQRCDAPGAFEMLLARVGTKHRQYESLVRLRDSGAAPQGFRGQAQLSIALDALFTTGARRVLRIGGVPGCGKTAALGEAVARAAAAGIRTPGAIRTGAHGDLAAVERAIDELRGEPDRTGDLVASAVEDLRTGLMQRYAILAERLGEACREQDSIVLVFDDVPADSPLDGFGRFLERLGDEGPSLRWVQSGGGHADVELTPLDVATVEQVIHIARPLRPADSMAAEALQDATFGNPALIAALLVDFPGDELLRAAQDGDLAREDGIDAALEAAFDRRLAALDEVGRSVAVAVALLEAPVPLALLRRIPGVRDGITREALEAAFAGGLLCARSTDAGAAVAPAGELIRRRLSAWASDDLMRAIAANLEEIPSVAEAHAANLGSLWRRLGEPQRARVPLLSGARRARAQLRLADALALYDAYLEVGGDERGTAQVEAARVLLALGRPTEAIDRFSEAAAAGHPQWRTGTAAALISLGRYGEAAERLTGDDGGPEGEDRSMVEALAARACMLAGRYDEADEIIGRATRRTGAHPKEAQLRNVQGLVAFYRTETDRARELLETAVELARAGETPRWLGNALSNLALVLHKAGDLSGAEAAYSESIAVARREHDLPLQVNRLANLAALRQEQRQFDAALRGYAEAASLARLMDGRREGVRVSLNRANLLGWLGDTANALDFAVAARADAADLGMATEQAYLGLVEAELHLANGDSGAADTGLEDSRTLFGASDNRAGLAECDAVAAEIALHRRDAATATRLATAAAKQAAAIGRERIEAQALTWKGLAALDASGIGASGAAADTDPRAEGIAAAERAASLAASMGDPDLGWLAHGILAQLLDRAGRDIDADFHVNKSRQLASAARSRISARYERSYGELWYRRELWSIARRPQDTSFDEPTRNLDRLLAINRELARDHNPDRLLERIIDAAIALSGAERGFIVLRPDAGAGDVQAQYDEDSLVIQVARNIDRESLAAPEDGGDIHYSRSIAVSTMRNGMPVTSIDAQRDERFSEYLSVHALELRSVLCLPLRSQDAVLGALYLDNRHRVNAFSDADVALLSAFGDQAAIALANARLVTELGHRSSELERSRRSIEELNLRLQKELEASAAELEFARARRHDRDERDGELGQYGMVGKSAAMREIYRIIDRVADRDVVVTILGESGTGKELVARAIHGASKVHSGAFVSVNCGAIPGPLLESELFGHERGAFTGAVRSKPGLFEVARGGTIFLDEIGDMPKQMQVKLLRVLQQKEYRRVGGTRHLTTDARVVSASNRDLAAMVRSGEFREDLWYRLNVVEIHVPPLRERREDLPLLIGHMLALHGGDDSPQLSRAAHALLLDHDWPGNIRELENEIQRAVALSDGAIEAETISTRVRAESAPAAAPRAAVPADTAIAQGASLKQTVERFECEVVAKILDRHGGKVAAAAEEMGLTRAGLYKKMNKYGLNVDKKTQS